MDFPAFGSASEITVYTCYGNLEEFETNTSFHLDDNDHFIPNDHDALVFVIGQEANTEEAGWQSHYTCPKCGAVFADAEGQNEVTPESLIIPKKETFFTRLRDFFLRLREFFRRLAEFIRRFLTH